MCLQGHLDMVCEKSAQVSHDFSTDPIVLVRRGNALMANGTTLGADNGNHLMHDVSEPLHIVEITYGRCPSSKMPSSTFVVN